MSHRGVLLAALVGFVLISPPFIMTGALGGGKPPRTGPIYYKVQIANQCSYTGYDYQYLYNVDENRDGIIDSARWYFETPYIRLSESNPLGQTIMEIDKVISPARSINQWEFIWYGFKATGKCDQYGSLLLWQLQVVSGSVYRRSPNVFYPGASLRVQLTVDTGQTVTLQNLNDLSTKTGVMTTPWYVNSGPWIPSVNPDNSVVYFGGDFHLHEGESWISYPADFAWQIKNVGFPNHDLAYQVAYTQLRYDWRDRFCPSASSHADSTVTMTGLVATWPWTYDPSGRFWTFDSIDNTRCWYVMA